MDVYEVLYLEETLGWCVYALYISDRQRINKHCLVDNKMWYANLAFSLDDYLWAVSSLLTK